MKKCSWGVGCLLVSQLAIAGSLPSLDDVRSSIRAENWPQAQSQLNQVLAAKPENALAHYLYAQSAGHLGQGDVMCKHYEDAIRLDAKKSFVKKFDVLDQMASLCSIEPKAIQAMGEQNWPVAEVLISKLISATPNNPQYFYWLTLAKGHNGDRTGACDSFHRATTLDPEAINYLSEDERSTLHETCDNGGGTEVAPDFIGVQGALENSMGEIGSAFKFLLIMGLPIFLFSAAGSMGMWDALGESFEARRKRKQWRKQCREQLQQMLLDIDQWLRVCDVRVLDLRLAALDGGSAMVELKQLESSKAIMFEHRNTVDFLLKRVTQKKEVTYAQVEAINDPLKRILKSETRPTKRPKDKEAKAKEDPSPTKEVNERAVPSGASVVSQPEPITKIVQVVPQSSMVSNVIQAVAVNALVNEICHEPVVEHTEPSTDLFSAVSRDLSAVDVGQGSDWGSSSSDDSSSFSSDGGSDSSSWS